LSTSSTKPFLPANEFRNERQLRRRTMAHIIPPMKAVYTEEEAFAILFPDERSRQGYREELARMEKAGAPTPTVATLRKIASVLDVCIADLIHEP